MAINNGLINHVTYLLFTVFQKTPKKRRKSSVGDAAQKLVFLALGTSSGDILLYSLTKGELHTQLVRKWPLKNNYTRSYQEVGLLIIKSVIIFELFEVRSTSNYNEIWIISIDIRNERIRKLSISNFVILTDWWSFGCSQWSVLEWARRCPIQLFWRSTHRGMGY